MAEQLWSTVEWSRPPMSFPMRFGGHLGVFLRNIHADLARINVVTLAALALNDVGRDIEMLAYRVDDIVNTQGGFLASAGLFDHFFSQIHIYIAVINNAIGHE